MHPRYIHGFRVEQFQCMNMLQSILSFSCQRIFVIFPKAKFWFSFFVCLFFPSSVTLLRILRMPWELVWKFLQGKAATCISLTKEQAFPLSRNVILFEQGCSYRKDTHRAGREEGNTFLASQISQITLVINGMIDVAVRSASHLRMALSDAWC